MRHKRSLGLTVGDASCQLPHSAEPGNAAKDVDRDPPDDRCAGSRHAAYSIHAVTGRRSEVMINAVPALAAPLVDSHPFDSTRSSNLHYCFAGRRSVVLRQQANKSAR